MLYKLLNKDFNFSFYFLLTNCVMFLCTIWVLYSCSQPVHCSYVLTGYHIPACNLCGVPVYWLGTVFLLMTLQLTLWPWVLSSPSLYSSYLWPLLLIAEAANPLSLHSQCFCGVDFVILSISTPQNTYQWFPSKKVLPLWVGKNKLT